MKKILCYGDSNTFGFNPETGLRYDKKSRWTGILEENSGPSYKIIEEGACDRTGFVDNEKGIYYSAQKHFPSFLQQSDKFDIIILAIGTNDLQFQYNIDFETIEKGLEKLINLTIKKSSLILIPPVILDENILDGFFKIQFDKTSIEKSKTVGEIYKKLAKEYNCRIFDINEITKPSKKDGLHYNATSHKLIGEKLWLYINREFS